MKTLAALFTVSVFLIGCAAARSPEMYRDDTKKLLDARDGDIKACYDGILKTDPKAGGKVGVKFAFEKDTGRLIDAKVDPASTTAPDSVGQCVIANLGGIVLQPGDKRRGEALWIWDFSAAQAAK